jgi:hypothetical protein
MKGRRDKDASLQEGRRVALSQEENSWMVAIILRVINTEKKGYVACGAMAMSIAEIFSIMYEVVDAEDEVGGTSVTLSRAATWRNGADQVIRQTLHCELPVAASPAGPTRASTRACSRCSCGGIIPGDHMSLSCASHQALEGCSFNKRGKRGRSWDLLKCTHTSQKQYGIKFEEDDDQEWEVDAYHVVAEPRNV